MELEKLRIFLAVAETENISAAARKLFVSHSTVSRAVAALEKELECELLARGRNSTQSLTDKGRILADEAQKIINTLDELPGKLGAAQSSAKEAEDKQSIGQSAEK